MPSPPRWCQPDLSVVGEAASGEEAVRLAAGHVPDAVLHPRVATRVMHELRGTRQEAPNPFAELTGRELEVLRLVAEALSNAQIAERLVLSQKTVKGYVSNILSKLYLDIKGRSGLTSRPTSSRIG